MRGDRTRPSFDPCTDESRGGEGTLRTLCVCNTRTETASPSASTRARHTAQRRSVGWQRRLRWSVTGGATPIGPRGWGRTTPSTHHPAHRTSHDQPHPRPLMQPPCEARPNRR